MEKQTAVQWLIDNLEKYEDYAKISWRCLGEIEIALEMEKQQIIDAFELWRTGSGEQYYNETYGSKGSDEHHEDNLEEIPTSSQTEISDEEIEKSAKEWFENKGKSIFWDYNTMPSFIEGAKWYREQLKKKQ